MDTKAVLAELTRIPGPSGFEQSVAERAVDLLRAYMDEAYQDRYGNAIGIRRCGKDDAKRLLLDAHLDEVGFVVLGQKDGFLRFRSIGGVDPRVLPNQSVRILTDPPILGLISSLPPHLQDAASQKDAPTYESLWIDTGLGAEEANRRIPIGTPLVFESSFVELQNDNWASKAMDDRAGFVVLLRAAELLQKESLDVDLFIMGSTREEVGGSGATVGTFSLAPDACVAVDVTHGRTPDAPREDAFPLGKGPAIGIGPNMNRPMTQLMTEQAEQYSIPWQREVMGGSSGTNAWHMQICREGVATAVLSIPLKYMHTPYEVMRATDLENTAQLIAAFVRAFSKEGGDLC